jgi:hypothetical protein
MKILYDGQACSQSPPPHSHHIPNLLTIPDSSVSTVTMLDCKTGKLGFESRQGTRFFSSLHSLPIVVQSIVTNVRNNTGIFITNFLC